MIMWYNLVLFGLLFSLTHGWTPRSLRISPSSTFQTIKTRNTRLEERKFAQPASSSSSNNKANNKTTTREIRKFGGDAKLASLYKERIRTAGRVGTKRFVDPNKLFVGNLPFDADDQQLADFILSTMGQSRIVLHSSKVIYDWKTGKSKGYGFVVFTDPIYATVCMEVCNGKMFNGRAVTVAQGKKKDQENQLYIQKKRKEPETEEEAAISRALEEAESDDIDDGIPVFGGTSDEDLELDAVLFGITGDDDDDEGYDGIFLEPSSKYEEVDDPNLNREQRREAARRRKRTKLPHKGFG